jgi:hypothetical protein
VGGAGVLAGVREEGSAGEVRGMVGVAEDRWRRWFEEGGALSRRGSGGGRGRREQAVVAGGGGGGKEVLCGGNAEGKGVLMRWWRAGGRTRGRRPPMA